MRTIKDILEISRQRLFGLKTWNLKAILSSVAAHQISMKRILSDINHDTVLITFISENSSKVIFTQIISDPHHPYFKIVDL